MKNSESKGKLMTGRELALLTFFENNSVASHYHIQWINASSEVLGYKLVEYSCVSFVQLVFKYILVSLVSFDLYLALSAYLFWNISNPKSFFTNLLGPDINMLEKYGLHTGIYFLDETILDDLKIMDDSFGSRLYS